MAQYRKGLYYVHLSLAGLMETKSKGHIYERSNTDENIYCVCTHIDNGYVLSFNSMQHNRLCVHIYALENLCIHH